MWLYFQRHPARGSLGQPTHTFLGHDNHDTSQVKGGSAGGSYGSRSASVEQPEPEHCKWNCASRRVSVLDGMPVIATFAVRPKPTAGLYALGLYVHAVENLFIAGPRCYQGASGHEDHVWPCVQDLELYGGIRGWL
ncbi:unnamed protein product [Symbiodinium natans]|uniref:Uncharacterized protein n=1 Tax=Symbiodinium natans TaxID=878477 RepID=A0A812RKC6_9DINO|nr:unnamed protein product [Symbiodinium natans]